MEKTISVQQGLNEIKLYDKKIQRVIQRANLVSVEAKGSVVDHNITIEDFKKEAQSSFDSIKALIANRNKIKQAIIVSNSVTKVTIGNDTMTVAEAIERKESIFYDKSLLQNIKHDLQKASKRVQAFNSSIDDDAQKVIEKALDGKSAKESKELVESIQAQYDSRKASVLEGVKNLDKISIDLEDSISQFESDVDFVLTTSNCTTMITVDLVD